MEADDHDEDDELVALAIASPLDPLPVIVQAQPGKGQIETQNAGQEQPCQEVKPSELAPHAPGEQIEESSGTSREHLGVKADEPAEALRAPVLRPARNAADIEGDYIAVTGSAGERVYCGLAASAAGQRKSVQQYRRQGHFLKQPISALMAEVCFCCN